MKLIVAGASGYLADEIVRYSLQHPGITEVVALSRKEVVVDDVDSSKLNSVAIKDYGKYPEEVKKEFAGAGACIWTVAITPSKSKNYTMEEVRRVCQQNAVDGLNAMSDAGPTTPFRFVYISGVAAQRDQTKTAADMPNVPPHMVEQALMRGKAENLLLAVAAESAGKLEVCAAKPGMILSPRRPEISSVLERRGFAIKVTDQEIAAALIDQVLNGFEKEPLMNDDLVRLGRQVLDSKKESL